MSLTIAVTAGKTLARNEVANNAKLNALGLPTLALSGTASTAQIGDDQVTAAKAAFGAWFLATDSGTASAHALTASGHSISAYATGMLVRYRVNAGPNTGSTTANLATLGAKKIFKLGSIEVQAGDLRAGQLVELVYDAALDSAAGGWWLISPIGNAPTWDRYATTASAVANAYTATFSPTITALTNGLRVLVKWNADNTSTATFLPDGLSAGAKAIRKLNDAVLVAGDIMANQISELVYDATLDHWLLTSPVVNAVSPAVTGSALNLIAKNNAGTPVSKVDIAADEIVLLNSSAVNYLARAVSVTVDLTASGANGLDTGSETTSTWYYFYVIYNPTTTTVAGLFSTSATAPTMPSGYTFKALVGAVYNSSGGDLATFYQAGSDVWLDETAAGSRVFTATTGTGNVWTSASLSAIVPPIAKAVAGSMGRVAAAGAANDQQWAVAGESAGLTVCSFAGNYYSDVANPVDTFLVGSPWDLIPLKTSQTIWWKTYTSLASAYRMTIRRFRL